MLNRGRDVCDGRPVTPQVDFTPSADLDNVVRSKYVQNPESFWGPKVHSLPSPRVMIVIDVIRTLSPRPAVQARAVGKRERDGDAAPSTDAVEAEAAATAEGEAPPAAKK